MDRKLVHYNVNLQLGTDTVTLDLFLRLLAEKFPQDLTGRILRDDVQENNSTSEPFEVSHPLIHEFHDVRCTNLLASLQDYVRAGTFVIVSFRDVSIS
jgi:hypothetical protein